jgi:hypothetical protein
MFTVAERDEIRERLLALAERDADVVAAAITGSYAVGLADEWSDIDLAFGIRGELSAALDRWTAVLYDEFAAIHHWDLPFGSSIYRVFLLPRWLEVDIAFTPAADFGPRGPNWRTAFGDTVDVSPTPPPRARDLVGLGWHYLLHARMCIERGKPWQAEWLLSGLREYVLALACLRLGHTTRYAKGADLLPREATAPLEDTLVRSLEETELRRALVAARVALSVELRETDPMLAARLEPLFAELVPG